MDYNSSCVELRVKVRRAISPDKLLLNTLCNPPTHTHIHSRAYLWYPFIVPRKDIFIYWSSINWYSGEDTGATTSSTTAAAVAADGDDDGGAVWRVCFLSSLLYTDGLSILSSTFIKKI